MFDPKTDASVLQAPQETARSAVENAEMQKQRLSFVLSSRNRPTPSRIQEAFAMLERRRLAARKKGILRTVPHPIAHIKLATRARYRRPPGKRRGSSLRRLDAGRTE